MFIGAIFLALAAIHLANEILPLFTFILLKSTLISHDPYRCLRWRLRRASAVTNRYLRVLGLEQHPDKTSIEPIARGFDFLGYQFDRAGLRLSAVTLRRHREKLTRLYERYFTRFEKNLAKKLSRSHSHPESNRLVRLFLRERNKCT